MSRTPTLLVYTAFPFPAAVRSPSGASPAPPTVRTGPSPRGPTRPSCRPPLRGAYKSRHQTGAALFSPHVLPRPVGSHRIASRRTGRRGRTAGPAPRSPGSCRFTAAGGWFGNSSSLRSCRVISVCRSLPLSASHRPAAAPPPTPHRCPFCSRRGTFTESWTDGRTDGRTAPLRSSRAEGGRSGQRFPGGFVDFLGRSEEAASPWDPRSSGEYLPRPEKPAPGRLAFSPGPPIRPR